MSVERWNVEVWFRRGAQMRPDTAESRVLVYEARGVWAKDSFTAAETVAKTMGITPEQWTSVLGPRPTFAMRVTPWVDATS